eukprot:6212918-Pyramimonas_sp.AAC.1
MALELRIEHEDGARDLHVVVAIPQVQTHAPRVAHLPRAGKASIRMCRCSWYNLDASHRLRDRDDSNPR